MGMEQETLIYIEENDKKEARVLTQSFASKEVKSRAYINALGAELGLKYLALENINSSKTHNLHSVHKILEEMDISDIMLSNIHIDVRVIFDENLIFIPKSHFEYEILPDIYLVLNLSEDHTHAKFLGFFEPKLINKNNQNNDYYFIEKEKLSSPVNLKEFIENFNGNTTNSLSPEENDNAEMLMVSLIDQNVSKNEMKELLKYLSKSADLRDKFIEFENFEVLSYKAEHSPDITIPNDNEAEETIDATLDDIGDIEALGEEVFGETENSDELPFDESEEFSDNTEINKFDENSQPETTEIENFEASENTDETDLGNIENLNSLDGFDDFTEISDISEAENAETNHDNSFMEGLSDLAEGTAEIGGAIAAGAVAGAALTGAAELGIEAAAGMTADVIMNAGEDLISGVINETVSHAESKNEDIDGTIENNSEIPAGETDLSDLNEDLPSLDDMIVETDSSPLHMADEENAVHIETQDIETLDTIEVPPLPDNSGSEMEVLDIDIENVDAVPNNLDANISETIEFNNIEATEDEPCSNAVNMETTRPTMDINSIDSFNGLEPINSDDMEFSDNSVDIDQLSSEPMEPIGQMGALSMGEMDPFAPVDLDNINLMEGIPQNNGAAIQQKNEDIENSLDADELGSSLDEIPDFGDDLGAGLDGLDEISDISDMSETLDEQEPVEEISPADEETSNITDMSELENLTVDDIVETPVDETQDSPETELSDMASSEVSEISELSEISEIPDENPEFSEIAGLDDLTDDNSAETENFDDISSLADNNEAISDADDTSIQDDTAETTDDDSELTLLFNENPEALNNTEQIQNLESPFLNRQPKQNNNLKVILVAVVAAMVLGGAGLGLMLKNKHSSADIEPLAQNEPEAEIPTEELAADNSDILANTPQVETIPAGQQETANVKEVKPAASAAKTAKPINPAGTYVTVKKLSWEVPDYLSYSNNITKYLQTAGKSIKLSLSSDLLLTSEYAYSNQVKVAMTLSNDGTLKDINIVKSSGSDQINKIVLQTVKDTLNVIKPATGEVPTPEFKLGLTINF